MSKNGLQTDSLFLAANCLNNSTLDLSSCDDDDDVDDDIREDEYLMTMMMIKRLWQ